MIVGSRLVRAAAEAADAGEDPAAAVGAVVAELAAALRPLASAPHGRPLTLIAGLVVWIVLWAIGAKSLRRLPDHDRCCCSSPPRRASSCRTCPGSRDADRPPRS